jgi:hypothetical protein
MKNFLSALFIALLLPASALIAQVKNVSLRSPDGNIIMMLTSKNNRLYYQVTYKHRIVIEQSAMGLTVNDKFIAGLTNIKIIKKQVINESYPWRGVHNTAIDHCNFSLIGFPGADTHFSLETRVYNDGVAFRYIVANSGDSIVNADNTGFMIPAGSTTWSQGDIESYEGKYQKQNIENIKEGQLVGPPLTIKLPANAGYAAITEGGVTNFAGMSLKAAGNRVFNASLSGITHVDGDIESPWRIIEIGKDLNTLVNCDIIANVSPKPDKELFPDGFATGWIKPGKSVWSWLAGNGGVSFENMKKYSKWAGELGIEYNLVDEGWSKWQDGDKDKWALVKELVTYSNEQHVKVWVWKAYPDRNNVPGLKDPKARWEFFTQCRDAGVAGIKIDFFDTEAQEVMQFYQDALRDAAKLHLMLDFHGADKPTGQSRTWPNEMSREGVRGLENGSNWPVHNTTLPFTRYLAGHGDYTPLSFRQKIIDGTTLTHQVATVLTFTSPFLCLAVNPQELLSSPVKDFIIQMPSEWDETIVLPQSGIGEVSVFARRKGSTWYLAVLNGGTEKDLSIKLSFLNSGNYNATRMEDDKTSVEKAIITSRKYSKINAITLRLQPGGGFAAKFVKTSQELKK